MSSNRKGTNKKRSHPSNEEEREVKRQRLAPSSKELKKLYTLIEGLKLPLLTAEEVDAMHGSDSQYLGKGTYGEAFLNRSKNIVIKYSFN